MQGFVNLGADFGFALSVLIPLICYLMGGGLLITSIYCFWQSSNGTDRSYKWKGIAAAIIAPVLLSFDKMLNAANNTFGGGVVTASEKLSSYKPPQPGTGGFIGATPEDTLLNIITSFQVFFKSYGALAVLFGVLALYRVMQGNGHHQSHTMGKPIVQMVFGIAVMNIRSIAATVMGNFG